MKKCSGVGVVVKGSAMPSNGTYCHLCHFLNSGHFPLLGTTHQNICRKGPKFLWMAAKTANEFEEQWRAQLLTSLGSHCELDLKANRNSSEFGHYSSFAFESQMLNQYIRYSIDTDAISLGIWRLARAHPFMTSLSQEVHNCLEVFATESWLLSLVYCLLN